MKEVVNNKRTVLVVEDEPAIAKVCVRILAAEGFDVEIAINGQIALNRLSTNVYDFCLVDIRTPEMNGVELYKRLKDDCPEMANRVIFSTGDVISDDIRAFLEGTGRPFLAKPFTPDELRSIFRVALAASTSR
ncbi:response regulator [Chloroflexota bacterium]